MLVTMKEIVDHATKNNYGVAAPNVSSEFDARAYINVAEDLKAPLILDVGLGANADIVFFGHMLRDLATQASVPVCINLDHGASYEACTKAIQAGFTSVMIDKSAETDEVNIAEVKKVVALAHSVGVTVEAEYGHVGQASNAAEDTTKALTDPKAAKNFVDATGVDCLAVAIGTAHGAYPKGFVPHVDIDRLKAIKAACGQDFPLVLHGSSGLDNDQLNVACHNGINKINIANELSQAVANAVQGADLQGQKAYGTWNTAKQGFQAKLIEKIKVYGSDGKAWDVKPTGIPHSPVVMEEK